MVTSVGRGGSHILSWDRAQIIKKGRFSCLFDFNGWSLCADDQSQNLVGTILRIWVTFVSVSEVPITSIVLLFIQFKICIKNVFHILVKIETILAGLV